jgi:hypothetical protein
MNLKLITTHKDYLLLVDTEAKIFQDDWITRNSEVTQANDEWNGKTHKEWKKIIAHLPKHKDTPLLEGVLLLQTKINRIWKYTHDLSGVKVGTILHATTGKDYKVTEIKNEDGRLSYWEGNICITHQYTSPHNMLTKTPFVAYEYEIVFVLPKQEEDEWKSLTQFVCGRDMNSLNYYKEDLLEGYKAASQKKYNEMQNALLIAKEYVIQFKSRGTIGHIDEDLKIIDSALQLLSPVKLPIGFEPAYWYDFMSLDEQQARELTHSEKQEYRKYKIINNILQGRWLYENN